MRKLPIFIVATSVVSVVVAVAAATHFLSTTPLKLDASAPPELTTGAIEARWPKPGIERPTAAAEPMPSVQPAETTLQVTGNRPVLAKPACNNPNALGISRTVQIDTTGGPGFGMSQYREYDFLQPGEVVLTFDDGPWPVTTPAILAALNAECLNATFFPIGKHAIWHPGILKQVVAQGHTVGSHTWSHQNLAHKTQQEAKDEIEKGMSAVAMMAGSPIAPFFRFPQLRQTAELKAYLRERNVSAFSIDIDSEDFKIRKPDALVASVMTKLKKTGKGIILMHDLHKWTAAALPDLLTQLKEGGYKVVHVQAKYTLVTLPDYDAAIAADKAVKTSSARPISNLVQNVEQRR
jgi:peptidoglycan/xylan/chitin deacetylase (PgdA/CDA1 family)